MKILFQNPINIAYSINLLDKKQFMEKNLSGNLNEKTDQILE